VRIKLPKIILPLFIFFSLFIFLSLPTKAQEFNFDRAQSDYLYNYNLYRQSYTEYIVAKEAYSKYKTLTSKTEALEKTRQMLKNQDEVIKTYLTSLRLKLAETSGISGYEQNVLYLKMDGEIVWFTKHQGEIQSAGSLEDLSESAKEGQNQYQKTEVLIYQTLGAILASKEIGLREEINQKIKELKDKVGEIRIKGDKNTTLAERWLLEAENRLTRSQEKQFAAQQSLSKIKVNDKNKAGSYNQAQFTMEESHQYLKDANSYLKEVLREIKSAD
jgi:hypothetical protein